MGLVQSTTGTGALTLNGVASGNLLVCIQSIFRGTQTQAAVSTPTDTNGTFAVGNADVPAQLNTISFDIGVGIFYEVNAASGTHVVTPEAATTYHGTLCEFSGMATSNVLDKNTSAKTADTSHTSQATGTTGVTSQNDEVVIIGLSHGQLVGAANVGYTDPVSGFTTLQKVINSSSDLAMFHAYKIISGTGTQTATFNWTATEAVESTQAAIATFKAVAGGSAALTGTATASITETDIRAGGKTIILTLTGDTFIAAGAGVIGSVANTQALVDGIDSGQAEATGWDAVVKVGIDVGTAGAPLDVIRTSNTVCTITLDPEATYNITATETITATIPAAVLTGAALIVATPTFTVSTDIIEGVAALSQLSTGGVMIGLRYV